MRGGVHSRPPRVIAIDLDEPRGPAQTGADAQDVALSLSVADRLDGEARPHAGRGAGGAEHVDEVPAVVQPHQLRKGVVDG